MEEQSDFEENILTCDLCEKEIRYGFCHCSGCHTNTCTTCNFNYYDCHGFHYFDEQVCNNCFPEYGKIVNNIFYCPRCAPKESGDEFIFKRDVYLLENQISKQIREEEKCNVLPYNVITNEELNDPKNWQIHKENKDYFKNIIRKRLKKKMKNNLFFIINYERHKIYSYIH